MVMVITDRKQKEWYADAVPVRGQVTVIAHRDQQDYCMYWRALSRASKSRGDGVKNLRHVWVLRGRSFLIVRYI